MASPDISWALQQFQMEPRRTIYDIARAYYLGDHRMPFATEKFSSEFGRLFQDLSDNLCGVVIDAVADRLAVTGFTLSDSPLEQDDYTRAAWALWRRNRMMVRETQVYRESLRQGDGYVIVWPDDRMRAAIWPQQADQMAVEYDQDSPGLISRAAKLWIGNDGHGRLNLYFPDRIERYQTKSEIKNAGAPIQEEDFLPWPRSWISRLGMGFLVGAEVVPNPYGRVPVFHFPNKMAHYYGLSELLDVFPLQDALNASLHDMLVAMEFAAFRQRWAVGLDVSGELDDDTGRQVSPPFDYGADRMLAVPDPNVKFGEFGASDLTQFLEVQESLRSEIARVTGTPLHLLFITKGDYPSGEAMKSAEARFTKKLTDKQAAHGDVWADAIAFGLRIEGTEPPADIPLGTTWQDVSPRTPREIAETLLMKQALGVPNSELWKELGYDGEQIAEWLKAAAVQPPPPPIVLPDGTLAARPSDSSGSALPVKPVHPLLTPLNVPGAEPKLPFTRAPGA